MLLKVYPFTGIPFSSICQYYLCYPFTCKGAPEELVLCNLPVSFRDRLHLCLHQTPFLLFL